MAGDICDVCGTKENISGVASSCLGPMSVCFCKRCHAKNAEPEFMMSYVFEEIGEDVADHVKETCTFKDGKYLSWKEYVEYRKSCK